MTNYTPKKANFLKQMFKKNNGLHNDSNNDQKITDDRILLNYYASLAMNHPDLILVFSPEGEIVSENHKSINEFLGYSARKKLHYKDLLSKDSYNTLSLAFNNTLKGKSERHEVTVQNKQGDIIYVLVTFVPIKQANAKVDGVYLIIRNNTEYRKLTQNLELNEKHLTHAQQIADIGSWEYYIDDDRLYCSDNFYGIFGFDETDVIPMNKLFQFIHPDDYQESHQIIYDSMKKGVGFVNEYRINHGITNEIHYIKVQAEVIWRDDKPYKMVGVTKDITTHKVMENKLETANKNFKHIFDNLNVGIWMRESIDGNLTFASKGMEELLQIPLSKLYDNPDCWKEMILPVHRNEVFEEFKLLSEGKSIHIKYRINTGDGTTKWVIEQTIPRIDDKGEVIGLFGMVVNITPEVEMQDQLKFFATQDPLTALPNQRSLYEELDRLIDSHTNEFAILYLDLDRFNVINDSFGHQVGDKVLKNVANRLISVIPDHGYIARLGSNDFIVVLENYPSKDAVFTLAEKIIERIEDPLLAMDYELHITTSIGISFFPEDSDNKLTLLENAHSALYHAKQQGKNNYQLYSFSRDISSYKKYVLEKDMRKAIVNEDFEMYYQPQVEPGTGIIQGAEALIRWNHEEWGLVSPGEFIPLAEENHLIHNISDWVIKKVCLQLREWRDKDLTLRPIAINLSPIRFFKKGLVELVKQQLELHQIPAKYLEFEITESSLLKSEKGVLSTIAALKELGVKIAIDDFGTGHASMNYLREFQADTIKIDQVFIKSSDGQNKKDRAIVSSILHLAKGLDMKIVAEGVEEYDQLEFLKQKECDLIQGYLFSKPVPAEKFEQMLGTGYLKPTKQKLNKAPDKERRKFYRFEFPFSLRAEMAILEVNKRKVDLGSAEILIKNISLGGLKILSTLKLPINSNMKFRFHFTLMNEQFAIDGSLVWKNEGKGSTFYYGIKFDITDIEEDRLAGLMNKMTVLRKLNQEIPDTDFIHEDAYLYLSKNTL
ncbi:hypothetical protein CIL05_03655 [Virgibacillus profundi]|uniref:PAS domain S-box protein n=1 Tax=Virgibacillus profundi TaxID=2024555 RepID=A0A2A2IGQ6_9BACI|nr:EAL domain-containing protein [Virgibacillus profundi]PAV30827.1 hypothetical protein CIL05_03655 [Virgibacillus profundi]PXY55010.1 PAS domain S-box protein [Virgibacillus profundi]